ncbi:MAG: isopeptide-forming domain-containing fimbrial protein [Lachnospiraceae bacterium]|nr:isopeptide-forming domain-containing fimbrial protein [Lachnospiraceae bacterium]
MKRTFKKWIALASAVIMALTMTMSVSATNLNGGGELTLYIYDHDGNLSGNTYSLYQIATFDVEADPNGGSGVVYTNIEVKSIYENDFDAADVAADSQNSDDMKALAVTLKGIATGDPGDTALVTDIDDGTVTNLKPGYYMLIETAHDSTDAYIATDIILVAVDGTGTDPVSNSNKVTLKETLPTIEKKIVLEDSSTNVGTASADDLVDANVAAIGDTITYQLESKIPNYPADAKSITYTITDTLSSGLTYVGVSSIVIGSTTYTVGGANDCENWISTDNTTSGGGTLTITIPSDVVLDNTGETVTVTFTATLNEKASVGETGNPNSVKLEYTNNWDAGSTYKTEEDSVITYTGKLVIEKVDNSNTATKLGGATFAIYSAKDHKVTVPSDTAATITVGSDTYYYYTTVTTSSDQTDLGTAAISGLDADTYYAVETVAPTGYSVDSTPQVLALTVKGDSSLELETEGTVVTTVGNSNTTSGNTVTWTVNSGTNSSGVITQQIKNKQGTTLPGTGGIGTTLFTFGGLALVILAAVMFIVYTKKQRKQA